MNKLLLAIIAVSSAIDETSDISKYDLSFKGVGGIVFTIECQEKYTDYLVSAIIAMMNSKGFKSRYAPMFDSHTSAIGFNFSRGK